jgi:hypothetical protein
MTATTTGTTMTTTGGATTRPLGSPGLPHEAPLVNDVLRPPSPPR